MTALLDAAIEYAAHGWYVFPLAGKVPRLPREEGGHGFKDATRTPLRLVGWWTRWPSANIGAAVTAPVVVIDIDPRNGGTETWRSLTDRYGSFANTLTCRTGSGGWHLYYATGRRLTRSHLGAGIDVKCPGRGYTVLPPSIHPDTGNRYEWVHPTVGVTRLPDPLVELLAPPAEGPRRRLRVAQRQGPLPSSALASVEWADLLEPHGWVFVKAEGAVDYWRRPGKTHGVSASVNARGTDRLHIFTSNAAPFEADTSYSRFGAYTTLNHGGDYHAAARQLAGQ
jgi:hypothetical protein